MEVCEIFRVISKSPLQTLLPATMPVEILDRHIRPGHNTKEDARGQGACGQGGGLERHQGTQDRHGEVVTDPGGKDDNVDDSCMEIHGNEGWIENYERMSEANEWSEDVSDKDISENK